MNRIFRALPRFHAALCLALFLALCSVVPTLAADITYPGVPLQTDPMGGSPNSLFPGTTASPGLSNNSVTVNGNVSGYVFGGVTDGAGTVTNNRVFINGVTVGRWVYGGYSKDGDATYNSVTFNDGTMSGGSVAGGYSVNGNATYNSVTFNDGMVLGVYGGHSDYSEATHNTVTINGGTVNLWVIGGHSDNSANNNSVIVNGGTVSGVVGGNSVNREATHNTVTINGGAVNGDVYGGNGDNSANNNSVTINGGAMSGDVYGGYAYYGDATNNTVTLSGTPNLMTARIYGGDSFSAQDFFTGNTLNLKTSNLTVRSLSNFQFLNFYLPTTFGGGGKMLIIAPGGAAQLSEYSDGSGRRTTVNVGIDGASSPLKAGEQVILIDASAGALIGTPANTTANGQGMQGVTLLYDFNITTANNQLLATVAGASANAQAKALPEGFVSGAALVNQTGELAAGKAMWSAVGAAGGKTRGASKDATKAEASTGFGFGTFGAISGGSMRYNTGSHVDMASLSLIAGLSFGADLPPGRLTLGAFFEYGTGSYDTYNSFSNAASVHGKGNIYHLGGGALARMDFVETGPGNFYTEASFRAGGVHNDYHSSDLRDALGRRASYDSYSGYYGFHAGLGYVWNITEQASLDLYGKYFWTRQQGDDPRLSTGDAMKFKDVDSSRLRFGGRFAYAVNEHLSPYIGAAWEHEFDGKARATTNGFDMGAPSLRGDTGIGELGFILKPSKNLPLSFDLGVQGYVGKREGVTGSLQVRYEF